jgi:hypothetical protein
MSDDLHIYRKIFFNECQFKVVFYVCIVSCLGKIFWEYWAGGG